jgi:hypothetical protein
MTGIVTWARQGNTRPRPPRWRCQCEEAEGAGSAACLTWRRSTSGGKTAAGARADRTEGRADRAEQAADRACREAQEAQVRADAAGPRDACCGTRPDACSGHRRCAYARIPVAERSLCALPYLTTGKGLPMSDAARDFQHDIALLRRAIEIASEATACGGLGGGEAAALSAEIDRLWIELAALTDRLARLR